MPDGARSADTYGQWAEILEKKVSSLKMAIITKTMWRPDVEAAEEAFAVACHIKMLEVTSMSSARF